MIALQSRSFQLNPSLRTDDLLSDGGMYTVGAAMDEIAVVLEGCTAAQAKVIVDVATATKQAMNKHLV